MNKSLTATLKYALVSDKKMSLIAKLVRGKKVEEALGILHFLPKKWANILHKVLKSAVNNAKNAGFDDGLYIKEIKVGAWPKIKRVRFTSRSRISHYIKFRSFVQVILDVKKTSVKKVTPPKSPSKIEGDQEKVKKTPVKKAPVKKAPAKKKIEKKD